MKKNNFIRTGVLAALMELAISPLTLAADTSQLLGKGLDENRDLLSTVMQGRNYMVQVDEAGNIKKIVDTGANGDGTEAQGIQHSATAAAGAATISHPQIPVSYQGQQAVDFLGADLAKVAEGYGFAPEKFKEILLMDGTARVDSNKNLFYVENLVDHQAHQSRSQAPAANPAPAAAAAAITSTGTTLPVATTTPLTSAFKLHSRPGSSKTIYLDFGGFTAPAGTTAWNNTYNGGATIVAAPYDSTNTPGVFDNQELAEIIVMWNRVAEDYISMDVDVTTEAPPSNDAILRTNAADQTWGTHVVITPTPATGNCGCSGMAYVGTSSNVNAAAYQPAWAYSYEGNNASFIAEAVSHEAGHTFGLAHDGLANPPAGYYTGHGGYWGIPGYADITSWGPIMGSAVYEHLTVWNPGDYPNANNFQNDLAVMASNGLAASADDIGDTIAAASSLTNAGTDLTPNIQTYGVIGSSTDVDMYVINSAGGLINLTVAPAAASPNLDTQMTLLGSDGSVILTSAPTDVLTATINTTLPAGVYYLAVTGSGRPQASATDFGYSKYGSLGQYVISGFYDIIPGGIAPVALPTTSTSPVLAMNPISFSADSSVGNGNIIGYQWDFGDGSSRPDSFNTA